MAIDPARLTQSELLQLVDATPMGAVLQPALASSVDELEQITDNGARLLQGRNAMPPELGKEVRADFEPYGYLSAARGTALIVGSILLGLGIKNLPQVGGLQRFPQPFAPSAWENWVLRGLIFLGALYLMAKQVDYYYGCINCSPKAGIFKAVGWTNLWEMAADHLLGVWGAWLLIIAGLWPRWWLPAFALYCFLGWSRCRLTLLRARTANRRPPTTEFRTVLGAIIRLTPRDYDLDRLAASIEGEHVAPGHSPVPKKAVFAGWIWSFCVYGAISGAGTLVSMLAFGFLPMRWAAWSTTGLIVLLLAAFGGVTSRYSLAWGQRNLSKFTGKS